MELIKKNANSFLNSALVLVFISLLFYFQQIDLARVYTKYFGTYNPHEVPVFIFFVLYTLLWFLIFPAVTSKIMFKENLKEMGLCLPEKKWCAIILTLIALALLIPWDIYFTKFPAFKGYSLQNLSTPQFIFMLSVLFPGYYIGEEAFFRGFLFLGLWKRIGWHSFWLTDIIFTLVHLGKPGLEILMCIPASIIFNALTLWTRSIFPAVAVHAALGILLTILMTFNITI